MSTKKTIQINPELFRMPGQKTLKNREKKGIVLTPVISPNNIKNKLLQRIKEHKNLQYKNATATFNKPSGQKMIASEIKAKDNNASDEFSGALNYLSELSRKQKTTYENERNKTIMHNKTVKKYSSINEPTSNNIITSPYVSLELPIELQEEQFTQQPFKMSYKTDNEVPYGCLKGGVKPSYRSWIQTRKNIEHPELTNILQFRPPTPPKKHSVDAPITNQVMPMNSTMNDVISREHRLEQIKTKIKKMQDQEYSTKEQELNRIAEISKNVGRGLGTDNIIDELPDFENNQNSVQDIEELIKVRAETIAQNIPKIHIKQTTKRTFTLGKSDKLRNVAVLIKNKQTRKNLINAQKELKKTDITDVRKYLRQHSIVKIGSTCPPDILRQTFESALMAGEITNTNKDTLIHNFLNEDIVAT